MVGTGRFELPTPRTPSECSTRLSHVPTRLSRPGRAGFWGLEQVYTRAGVSAPRVRSQRAQAVHLLRRPAKRAPAASGYCEGGTYSLGSAEPEPKKNSSIC